MTKPKVHSENALGGMANVLLRGIAGPKPDASRRPAVDFYDARVFEEYRHPACRGPLDVDLEVALESIVTTSEQTPTP